MNLFEQSNFYLIAALSAFYLIVFSTYLSFLFTCNVDNAIKNNQKLIIVMGYFLFFYLVTIANKTLIDDHPIENMLITLLYYIVFLFTTRMDIKITFIAILIIFIINFMELNKEHYRLLMKNKTDDKKIYWFTLHKPININLFEANESQLIFINDIQHILNYGLYILIAVGFLSFYGEMKYMKKNKNMPFYKLFFDRNICELRDNRSIYQNILHAINIK